MQAPDNFRDRYKGKYDVGYDFIRERRIQRQRQLGIIARDLEPNPLLPATAQRPKWNDLTADQKTYEARRMEIYAAMVENLDWNIGRLIRHLKDIGEYDNTFIFFQSDNGAEGSNVDQASAKNTLDNIGKTGSYIGYGLRWAEVSYRATTMRTSS
jgi:arylsulfatase A-like enzyme